MKYSTLFIILFFAVITLNSCSTDSKRNIKSYYYPIQELIEPLVYEYRSVSNDSLGVQYLYFRTMVTDRVTYFTTNIYNQFFEVEQFSVEEMVSNGMLQQDYFLYLSDTSGAQERIPAEIEYGNTFPFEVKDSTVVFLQKMKWTFSEDPLYSTTLIRNRRYIGDREYKFNDKTYDAVLFSVKEVIDDNNNGHLETETSGSEIYAKGIGLVYYKKTIGDGLVLEYELVDRYPMDVLENKFKEFKPAQ